MRGQLTELLDALDDSHSNLQDMATEIGDVIERMERWEPSIDKDGGIEMLPDKNGEWIHRGDTLKEIGDVLS